MMLYDRPSQHYFSGKLDMPVCQISYTDNEVHELSETSTRTEQVLQALNKLPLNTLHFLSGM